jgi:RNA polymerase sigma-70 factor, ECF subfamily
MTLTDRLHVLRQESPTSDGMAEPFRRALVQRSKDGDSDAFARLFDFYVERVFRYMYFHIANEQSADDLTARVFLKAWKNILCYEAGQLPFGVWIYRIARTALMEFVRNRGGAPSITEIVSPMDEGLEFGREFRLGEGGDRRASAAAE